MYKEVAGAIKKDPAVDVFDLVQELGLKEAERILKEKEKAVAAPANIAEIIKIGYPLEEIKKAVIRLLKSEYPDAGWEIEVPPAGVEADLAVPCFAAAKIMRVNPNEIAKKVAELINGVAILFVRNTVAAGGYANIRLNSEKLGGEILVKVFSLGDWFGASLEGDGKLAIIEYSSPNAAKPMSVGHLRSTIIGAAIQRLYEFQGYKAIGINHLGDFGTQFGKLLYAYFKWGNEEDLKKDPIGTMLKLYIKFHEEAAKDEELDEKAREIFKKLERGNKELLEKWAEFCEISARDFERIYEALGVKIDLTLGESFYKKQLEKTVGACLDKKIAVQNDDSSVAVNFPDEILPSYLLRKKDGSSLYATRDIAAALFRTKFFNPEKIIYVVGSEQTLHFRQVFKTLEFLGYDPNVFYHASFGMVSLPEGKMSTRAGRVVFLENLIKEAVDRAKKIVSEKNPDLSEKEKDEIAKAVGIGAIIYSDLSQNREKNIVFDWDKALNLEGDSAPYLQYTYARAKSILRKAGEAGSAPMMGEKITITTEREENLIKLMTLFPDIAKRAATLNSPHIIAEYLNDLARAFNRFYAHDPVLEAEPEIRNTRLVLVQAAAQVVKSGLLLLSIKTLERM